MLSRTIPSQIPGTNIAMIEEDRSKELKAALSIYHPTSFNWDAIFSGIPIPIHPDYPYSSVHYAVSQGLLESKRKIQDQIYYPTFSTKTVGADTKVQLRLYKNDIDGVLLEESTQGLEILYSRTGIKLEGVTEMRTSFSLNDLRPRSYYARGPSVYFPSRFIQPIFNILIDMIPVTNRRTRFLLSAIRIEPQETLFIYDYSSFTSTLFEIRNFTEALARYFSDTYVTIVDSFSGPESINLGDLLHLFNQTCNVFPEFSVQDLFGSRSPGLNNFHNCGMLGVPGNISSCTLLHGIHLAVLLCTLLCRCVGDDAIGKEKREKVQDLIEQSLTNIGRVSLEKSTLWDDKEDNEMETSEHNSWYYTKRPITRFKERIIVGNQAVFPPFTFISRMKDEMRTFSWPATDELFAIKAYNYIRRFSQQFISFTILSDSDEEFANQYIILWNRVLRSFLVNCTTSGFSAPLCTKYVPRSIGTNGILDMIRKKAYSGGKLQLRKIAQGFWEDEYISVGFPYSSRMTQALSYSVKLGFATSEEELITFVDPEEYIYESSSRAQLHVSYSHIWSLSLDCPSWLVVLIRESLVSVPLADEISDLYDMDYESDTD